MFQLLFRLFFTWNVQNVGFGMPTTRARSAYIILLPWIPHLNSKAVFLSQSHREKISNKQSQSKGKARNCLRVTYPPYCNMFRFTKREDTPWNSWALWGSFRSPSWFHPNTNTTVYKTLLIKWTREVSMFVFLYDWEKTKVYLCRNEIKK